MLGFNSLGVIKIKISDLPLISSRKNPLVHRLKSLAYPKGRYQSSTLLLEGTNLLQEALKTSFLPALIIATSEWIQKHSELLQDLANEVELIAVTQSVLEASLTTVHPDGVASLFPLDALPKSNKEANFVLALDRLQDPGNLGTLFRTALAANIEEVWLVLGADPLGQKVLRSSSGAVLHLPFERFAKSEEDSIKEFIGKLNHAKSRGMQIVSTNSPRTYVKRGVLPYWELDWIKPTVLILGNEGTGIHSEIQDCCTHSVTLPHNELVESLNVASAAVPLLLERLRARMTS